MGRAGWYDDIGNPGVQRYWDGEAWTERARTAQPTPLTRLTNEATAARTGSSPEELRQRAWSEQFPRWDVAVPREGEPGYPAETAGGAASWETMFAARFLSRYGLRPLRFWLTVWTGILLVLLAWLVAIGRL